MPIAFTDSHSPYQSITNKICWTNNYQLMVTIDTYSQLKIMHFNLVNIT